ncbi:hypothetical protein NK214_12120 [Chromobacterium sp. S0633]|uniref:hypothetical protein n=1 Tax=Chromobacterium sp. S0633 TaxID=2957805 RepID=UPI0020A22B6E|nr:hypothetical protein [Chromobacterium sp. S0633]MCP1290936.1 hypothetical protein [Chromobacterium sp. S0633]
MAAENQFRLTITAVDKATAVFNRIQSKLGSFGKRLDLSKSLGSLDGKLASMRFDTLSKKAAGFGSTLARAAEPMNVVVGAATIGGLAAAASNWASLGSNVLKTSQIIGVSTQDLQSLRGAAKLAGVSAEQLDGGLAQLGTTLNDAFYGRNMQALALLNKLGIGIHRTKDGAIDTTRALKDLADALANPKMNAQTKSMLAGQFGLQGLLPMLLGGSKNLTANQGRATQLGAVQSDAELRKAAETEQKKREAALAGQHAENWLGSTISPLYNKIMETATKWLSESPGMTIAGSAAMGVAGTWMAKKALQAVGSKLLNAAAKSAAAAVTETGGAAAAATGAEVAGTLGGLGSAIMAWVSRLCAPAYLLLHSDSLNAGENEWIKKRMQDGGLGSKTWHGMDINGREYTALRDKARGAYQPWYEFGDEKDLGYMERYVKEHPKEAPKGWTAQAAVSQDDPIWRKRGIRNNNPGNLQFVGQAGARKEPGAAGRFAVYDTPQQGLDALAIQIKRYANAGKNSVRSIIEQFAPRNENNTESYIAGVAKHLGVSDTAPLDFSRRDVMSSVMDAIVRKENGKNPYQRKMLDASAAAAVDYQGVYGQRTVQSSAAARNVNQPAAVGDSNGQIAALLAQLNDNVSKLGQLKVNVQTHVTGLPSGASAQSKVASVGESPQYNFPMPEMVTP